MKTTMLAVTAALAFTTFASRPTERLAREIIDSDTLSYDPSTNRATLTSAPIDGAGTAIDFACHQEPVVGDFVCYLNDEDIYHIPRAVFIERNVMPEDAVRDSAVTARAFNPSGNEVVDGIKKRVEDAGCYIIDNTPDDHRRRVALDHLEAASMFAVKNVFYDETGRREGV